MIASEELLISWFVSSLAIVTCRMPYAAHTFEFWHTTDTFANERMYIACFSSRRIDILQPRWTVCMCAFFEMLTSLTEPRGLSGRMLLKHCETGQKPHLLYPGRSMTHFAALILEGMFRSFFCVKAQSKLVYTPFVLQWQQHMVIQCVSRFCVPWVRVECIYLLPR